MYSLAILPPTATFCTPDYFAGDLPPSVIIARVGDELLIRFAELFATTTLEPQPMLSAEAIAKGKQRREEERVAELRVVVAPDEARLLRVGAGGFGGGPVSAGERMVCVGYMHHHAL